MGVKDLMEDADFSLNSKGKMGGGKKKNMNSSQVKKDKSGNYIYSSKHVRRMEARASSKGKDKKSKK